jgi:hypothetical protein
MFNLLLFLKKAVLSSCSLRMRNQRAPVISGAGVRSLLVVTKDALVKNRWHKLAQTTHKVSTNYAQSKFGLKIFIFNHISIIHRIFVPTLCLLCAYFVRSLCSCLCQVCAYSVLFFHQPVMEPLIRWPVVVH